MAGLHTTIQFKEYVMKKLLALTLLTFSSASFATLIDLSSWSKVDYDVPGAQAASNWALSNANQTVTQTVNADPSLYRNGNNLTQYTMEGKWKVQSGAGDDDFMGFVFGYQNEHQFYIMDWKKNRQSYAGGTAEAGFRILKIDANSKGDLILNDFWGSNTLQSEILKSEFVDEGVGTPWVHGATYDFSLDFRKTTGDIAIKVMDGALTLWDIVLVDNTFMSGEFGFYNFSQGNVEYSGFERTGGVPGQVPIPAAAFMFAPALLGFMGLRRRAKNNVA